MLACKFYKKKMKKLIKTNEDMCNRNPKKYHGNQLQHFLHNTVYCTN
jgi:hypothetical protein